MLVHILREDLPWRTPSRRAECGRLNPRSAVLIDDVNEQMTICKTCSHVAVRVGVRWMHLRQFGQGPRRFAWDVNPAHVMQRAIADDVEFRPDTNLNVELWALAQLARIHADQFEVLMHVIRQRKGIK